MLIMLSLYSISALFMTTVPWFGWCFTFQEAKVSISLLVRPGSLILQDAHPVYVNSLLAVYVPKSFGSVSYLDYLQQLECPASSKRRWIVTCHHGLFSRCHPSRQCGPKSFLVNTYDKVFSFILSVWPCIITHLPCALFDRSRPTQTPSISRTRIMLTKEVIRDDGVPTPPGALEKGGTMRKPPRL